MTFLDLSYGIFLLFLMLGYWYYGRFFPAVSFQQQDQTLTARVSVTEADANTQSIRLWFLLVFSVIFYSLWQIQYLPLLLLGTVLNFYLAKAIEARVNRRFQPEYSHLSNEEWENLQSFWNTRATQLLILAIILNVLLLVFFKYIPFLIETFGLVVGVPAASQGADWVRDRLIAPLGLSFFTFECLAYIIDVYRGAPASHNFLSFASYKLFFPKLISGPITRYHQFIAQFKEIQYLSSSLLTEGLWLLACGAVKKALIADRLGIFVDLCFGNLARAGSGDLWLATLTYGLQLYFDFSGYVDMARGSAMLLGLHLPENFDFPYFTTSLATFWRRWHITLGDWLRNYLYFPLGGSRQGLKRTCWNLLLVMAIAGIWHGASWGYVIWGIVHGLGLVVHRLTEYFSQKVPLLATWWLTVPGQLMGAFITQIMVFLAWIFFRLPDVNQALTVFAHYFNYLADIQFAQKVYGEGLGIGRSSFFGLVLALITAMGLTYFWQKGLKLQLTWQVKLVLVPLSLFSVWLLAPEGGSRYIYFDF